MIKSTLGEILPFFVPILAGIIGWFALWRRNILVYKAENAHFCGDELSKSGFWENKGKRRPLIDALNFSIFNFGLKHLDEAEIIMFNVSPDFVFHPFHPNGIPESKWDVELLEDDKLQIKVRDVPPFERFGFSLLNTHPKRSGGTQGSGKNYKFVFYRTYRKNLLRILAGFSAIVLAGLSIYLILR